MSGFSVKLLLHCLPEFKELLVEEYLPEDLGDSLFALALIQALESVAFRARLSDDDSCKMLTSFLEDQGVAIPDGADFLDFMGDFLDNFDFIGVLEQFPPVREMMDCLKEHALCDINFGASCEEASIYGTIKTEGVPKFYEMLMEGFEPGEDFGGDLPEGEEGDLGDEGECSSDGE